jgi:hypothetical protein
MRANGADGFRMTDVGALLEMGEGPAPGEKQPVGNIFRVPVSKVVWGGSEVGHPSCCFSIVSPKSLLVRGGRGFL